MSNSGPGANPRIQFANGLTRSSTAVLAAASAECFRACLPVCWVEWWSMDCEGRNGQAPFNIAKMGKAHCEHRDCAANDALLPHWLFTCESILFIVCGGRHDAGLPLRSPFFFPIIAGKG